MTSIYANVVTVRVTEQELVLEFGTVFSDDRRTRAAEFTPDVRIVLAASTIPRIVQAINRAVTEPGDGMPQTVKH